MALISPILNRELLTFLRAKRAFAGLLVFLVLLAAAAGLCWWASLLESGIGQRDLLSRSLFITVTIAQLLIFSAYALILTATKVNAERDAKTFDLLASAPLTGLHIVLAKYGSALAVILLLVVASAPVLSLCFLLGGVGWQEVVSAYYVILVAVLAFGMIGMACSVVCRRNYVALFAGFTVALFLYIGAPLLYLLAIAVSHDWFDSPSDPGSFFFLFRTVSPLGAYLGYITPAVFSPFGATSPTVVTASHTLFYLFLLVFSFVIAWRGVRSLSGRRSVASRRRTRSEAVQPLEDQATETSAPAQSRRRYTPIRDRVNPVYVREDRLFLSRRWKHRLIRYALGAAVFLALWAFLRWVALLGSGYKFTNEMCTLGCATAFLVCLLVPLVAARAVTIERETQTLPLLTVTRLRPGQILLGKTRVLAKHAFRAELLFTLFLLSSFADRQVPGGLRQIFIDWLKILLPLFAVTVFVASIGLLLSVLCRKTVTAIVLAYAIILALAFSPAIMAIVYALLDETLHLADFRFLEVDVFTSVSPVVSPLLYFIPFEHINRWHQNDQWPVVLSYSVSVIAVSSAILLATKARFMRWFPYERRRRWFRRKAAT